MERISKQAGQSLVEILVAAFILGMLAIALAGVSVLGTKTAVVSEQRTVAQALANQREELVKLTPYLDVGYSGGGTPDGIFLATETVTRNNQAYEIKMDITLVDDQENGCLVVGGGGECDTTGLTEEDADYKKVVISVKYPAADDATKEVKISTFSVKGQAEALLGMVECDASDVTGSCGLGQICCDERCLPKCEPGSCPDGYACAADGCGCEIDSCPGCLSASCFDDWECAASNQQCLGGSCSAKCINDGECGGGKCLYGICLDPCANNNECNSDQVCQDGYCQMPGCLVDTDCRVGYSCTDFQCQPTTCADAGFCPSNFECIENACMPAACSEGTCPGSWECVYGHCQPPWCSGAQSCNGGLACVEAQCQPAVCQNHEQCQGYAVCLGGTCTSPPACPPACPASLSCVAGFCLNPNMTLAPLVLTNECPAPMTFPCLPAIGEVTVTWVPVEGEVFCEPSITIGACTTDANPAAEWSDTDGDGITNCGPPATMPSLNACSPLKYPIECGSSDPSFPSCPVSESCIEGRCMPDQPCPAGYANHPTLAGKCVEEVSVAPPVACPGSCPGSSYCVAGECVTAGCLTDAQCALDGNYICRNNVCIPKEARDCSFCIPPERIQYCYSLDCPTCGGGPGSACTDPLGAPSVVVWTEDKTTGCSYLTCEYAPSVCEDGILQPGEDCDTAPADGNCPGECGPLGGSFEPACQCPAPFCGNGIVDQGEVCDWGMPPGGGSCLAVQCGNGVPLCACPTLAPPPLCGNGLIDYGFGEVCDWSVEPDGCAWSYCNAICICETLP